MPTVSFTEAAKRAGISKSDINRAVKEGQLSAKVSGSGQKMIDLAELAKAFPARNSDGEGQKKAAISGKKAAASSLADKDAQIAELQAKIQSLEVECQGLRNELMVTRYNYRSTLLLLEEVNQRRMVPKE